jgi:dTDP-4-dehydrorhamnose 3,5-epimerase
MAADRIGSRLRRGETEIDGLMVLDIEGRGDDRGVLYEVFRRTDFQGARSETFVWQQINLSETYYGALRGMHGELTTKFAGVAHGSGVGAYVDARAQSPTCGRSVTVELYPGRMVLIPPGVCNGLQSTSRSNTLYVCCFDSEIVAGMRNVSVNPLDPGLAIPWPIQVDPHDRSQISLDDVNLPTLESVLSSMS